MGEKFCEVKIAQGREKLPIILNLRQNLRIILILKDILILKGTI